MLNLPQNPKWDIARVSNCPIMEEETYLSINGASRQDIGDSETIGISTAKEEVKKLCEFHDYDFYKYKGKQPINKMARNLVDYEAGRTIFETVLGIEKKSNVKQVSIFDTIT